MEPNREMTREELIGELNRFQSLYEKAEASLKEREADAARYRLLRDKRLSVNFSKIKSAEGADADVDLLISTYNALLASKPEGK